VWTFHSASRSEPTERSKAEDRRSRLKQLEYREIDLLSRLSVLEERRMSYPHEVTDRQVDELDRRLDEVRAEIATLRAELPTHRD
jgi:hypothetical protein